MATDSDLLTEQSRLLASINRTLELQVGFLDDISNRMSSQSGIANEAASAIDGFTESSNAANESMAKGAEATAKATGLWESFTSKIKGFVGDGVWEKFSSGFSSAFDLLKINVESLYTAITNPFAAALGFLTQTYDALIAKAIEYRGAVKELESEFENVRDKFGSFNENTSRTIKSTYQKFSRSMAEAAGSSSTFASKFNMGIRGSIEMLQKVEEIAGDMGPAFDALGQQFADASVQLYVLKDGLHFTSDALQQVATLSMTSGKSLKQFSQEIMASVDKIGRQFNISTKVLGADVGKALSNFKMLGRMTGDYVKEITKAAVFTRKLGIELTELTGIVDKFDEFEGGAEAAASLAQSFGMVIDPLKMMGMEAGPRLQELQRAFMSTGKSVESLTRQERKLLSETAGLTEEQALRAFSAKGLAMSYDEIAKGAEDASKKQRTTEEVVQDLADNIKNVIRPLMQFEGFVSAFVNGFTMGFMRSGGMLDLLNKFGLALEKVSLIGEKTGVIFGKIFFTSTAGTSWVNMMTNVSEMFMNISTNIEKFAESIDKGASIPDALSKLLENIYGNIESAFFDSAKNVDIGKMAMSFGTMLLQVLTAGVKFLSTRMRKWTEDLKGEFTSDSPDSVTGGLKDAMNGLIDVIPDLVPTIYPFFEALIGAIGRAVEKFPIASLFLVGGPLVTVMGSAVTMFYEKMSELFAGATGAAGGGGAAIPGVEAAKEGISSSVTTGLTDIVMGVVSPTAAIGNTLLEKIAGVVETPAKIALTSYAVTSSLGALAVGLRDAISVFTDPMPGGGRRSFMDVIKTQMRSFADIPMDGIIKFGLVMGGIVAALGAAVGGIYMAAKNLTADVAIAALLAAGTAGAAAWLGYSLVPKAGIRGFIGSIITNTGLILLDVGSSLNNATFITAMALLGTAQPTINRLASTSGTIADLIGAVSKIADAAPKSGYILKEIDFSGVKKATDGIIDFLTKGDGGGFITKLGTLSGTADLSKQITTLYSVVEILTPLVQISSALTGGITEITDVENVKKLVIALKGTGFNQDGIIDKLISLPSDKGFDGQIKTMDGVSKILTSINTTSNDLNAIQFAEESKTKVNGIIDLLKGTGFNQDGIIDKLGEIKGDLDLSGQITALYSTVEAITPIISIMSGVDAIRALEVTPESIQTIFSSVQTYMTEMETITTKIASSNLDGFLLRLGSLLHTTTTARDILANLSEISLDGTIDKIAENMNVAKTTMSINGGAVTVKVNLNVSMNAEKMAASLVMNGFVKANDDFDKYLQTNDGVGEYYENPGKNYVYNSPNAIKTAAGVGVKAAK